MFLRELCGGDSVRHTQLFIKGSRGLTSELPKFVTKREPSGLNMPQLVRCYVVLKCEGVGLLFLGNGDPTHWVPPIFKKRYPISTMHTILRRQ